MLELVSTVDDTVHAGAQIPEITGDWKRYEAVLTTPAESTPSVKNRLVLSTAAKGTVWFSMVSLFPPTFKDRPNGNRPDIMRILADFKPAFLRFPGGNYLEGNTIETRFDWKKTIGDIATRPGHMNDAWRYWSSDGMGLLEFLLWCEDLHMQPVLGVYAGYSLRQQRVKVRLGAHLFAKPGELQCRPRSSDRVRAMAMWIGPGASLANSPRPTPSDAYGVGPCTITPGTPAAGAPPSGLQERATPSSSTRNNITNFSARPTTWNP
jgi:hypothetical protein